MATSSWTKETSGWTDTVTTTTREISIDELPPHILEKIQQQREMDALLLSDDNQSDAIEQKRLRVSEATVREAMARSGRKIRTVSELSDDLISESNVFERVRKIIVKQLEVEGDEVQPNSRLVEDLGADSLDIVEMVMAVEEEFNVEIRDERAEQFRTVGDVVRFLSRGGD